MVATAATSTPSKGLHISLWVVQVLLGISFVMAGLMKSTTPIAELAQKMAWVTTMSPEMVRFIGISELLGGVGMILPAATRIMPKLTAFAGVGLTVVMVLAFGFHINRGEFDQLMPSLILGLMSAFVAWGRMMKAPIAAR